MKVAAATTADNDGTVKPPRCPACGSFPNHYDEIWIGHSIQFAADLKGRPAKEGYMGEGSPFKVIATCRCGRSWKLRGVTQITELQQQPDEAAV